MKVSHEIILIVIVITSHQRVILNLFQDILVDIEMPIRHWRDGMTLRTEIVVKANECLAWNHPYCFCHNLPPTRHPELVSGSLNPNLDVEASLTSQTDLVN